MKKLIILFILIVNFGCSEYVDDAFLNPNASTTAKPETVLPSIEANIARGYQFDSRFLGRYVHYWTITTSGGTWDRMGYDPGSDNGGDKWRSHYWTSGINVLNMIADAEKEGQLDFAGAGHAIMAHGWLTLTDYHGEVILNEAFNTSALTFKFDPQEQVYQKALAECDFAIQKLNKAKEKGASESFKKADFWMNKGNLDQWIKYTNGIRAKVLHRYSLKSSYKPDDVIKAVDAALANENDDVMINFENNPISTLSANFYGPIRQNLPAYRASDLIIRYMDGTVFTGAIDPRMAYIFKPSTDNKFRGVRVASGEATSVPAAQKTFNFYGFVATASPAAGIDTASRTYFKNRSPFPIMTYAELQFIKAEAAFLKGDKATALAAYKNGIRGNMNALLKHFTGYTTMTTAQIEDFINKVSPANSSDLTLSTIMMQKFVALWGYGFEETWVDLRRYQYSPDIYATFQFPTTIYPDNGGLPVQRVRPRYNSEYLWNFTELGLIGANDANYHTKPVWFSQK
ncbi:MAG: SusD/RagB family nutrient-binding outer membrane lipoprotein [Saprospiraceae bacterium]|nr:SusD/RagB family nutrient-binding outer membrane lipoprotein [Saprospiraceae bacterium]